MSLTIYSDVIAPGSLGSVPVRPLADVPLVDTSCLRQCHAYLLVGIADYVEADLFDALGDAIGVDACLDVYRSADSLALSLERGGVFALYVRLAGDGYPAASYATTTRP